MNARTLAFVFVASIACSDPPGTEPKGNPDGGTDGSSASEDADAGPLFGQESDGAADAGPSHCNALPLDGPEVTSTNSPDPAPVGVGGEIADGTYVLTAVVAHGSNPQPPITGRGTFQVRGPTLSVVQSLGAGELRASGSLLATGNALSTTVVCSYPIGAKGQTVSYSATPSELRLYAPDGLEQVLSKR